MRRLFLLAAVVLLVPFSAQAQYDTSGRKLDVAPEPQSVSLAELLPSINKASVVKSYLKVQDLLKREVRDSQEHVVGEVRDVYVVPGGTVSAVSVVFNRLRVVEPQVFFAQEDGFQGLKDSYKLTLSGKDIQAKMPQIKERTAAHPVTDLGLNIKKALATEVNTEEGKSFAQLKELLFDPSGMNADLAFLAVNYGPLRNKALIVPFSTLQMQSERGRVEFYITSSDLETILKFLTQPAK